MKHVILFTLALAACTPFTAPEATMTDKAPVYANDPVDDPTDAPTVVVDPDDDPVDEVDLAIVERGKSCSAKGRERAEGRGKAFLGCE